MIEGNRAFKAVYNEMCLAVFPLWLKTRNLLTFMQYFSISLVPPTPFSLTNSAEPLPKGCLNPRTLQHIKTEHLRTCYGLDGPGFEPRLGGENFRTYSDQPRGPPSLLCNWYRVSFGRVKRPGRGADHLSPCSAEVEHGYN